MTDKPCPEHVRDNQTYFKKYCEAGPAGHKGTHIGNKSQERYLVELEEWTYFIKNTEKNVD
jgi:hypothetical protein